MLSYMIIGRPIMEKENLQDISLQSLQWLESRGLFGGGGGGSMHHMGSNKNINSNSGNGPNGVTSSNASGNNQLLGTQHLNHLNNTHQKYYYALLNLIQ